MSKYRQEYLIGAGGMGEVYRATRIMAYGEERPVACKVMRSGIRTKSNGIRRFHREARLTIELNHQHVVRTIDYLIDDQGGLYLITELVQGVSVAEIVDAGGGRERLSHDMIRVIADDALDALQYVHERGVLHRDISPGNLLVCQSGAIKVSDFGVAKVIGPDARQSGSYIGKIAYQAPEVRKGAPVDSRSDLFSFAATMYELLTGAPPFGMQMPAVAVRRLEFDLDPLPVDIPGDLRTMVMGLLARSPDERQPATARGARALLQMPENRELVAAELGKRARALFADKCARGARKLRERAKAAESVSARMLDARPVVEALADTLASLEPESGSATQRTSEGTDNGQRTRNTRRPDAGRSRMVLTLTALASLVLIVLCGSNERGCDSSSSERVIMSNMPPEHEHTVPVQEQTSEETRDSADHEMPVDTSADAESPAPVQAATNLSRLPRTKPSEGPGSAWAADWTYIR